MPVLFIQLSITFFLSFSLLFLPLMFAAMMSELALMTKLGKIFCLLISFPLSFFSSFTIHGSCIASLSYIALVAPTQTHARSCAGRTLSMMWAAASASMAAVPSQSTMARFISHDVRMTPSTGKMAQRLDLRASHPSPRRGTLTGCTIQR